MAVNFTPLSEQAQAQPKSTVRFKPLNAAQSALSSSQRIADTFRTPLMDIQAGQAERGVDVLKGAVKQGVADISRAGAQHAGPVGAEMLRGAPAFAQNVGALEQAVKPTNEAQAQGAAMTTMAEVALGTKGAKDIISNLPLVRNFLKTRELTKATKAIAPKLTTEQMREAPNVIKSRFASPRIDYSKDKQFMGMVEDVKGIVRGKSAIDDKNALRTAIETVSEQEVKPLLAQNTVPANFEDLIDKLKLVHPQSSLKADPSAAKTYNRVREEVQGSLYSYLKQIAKNKQSFGSQTDFNDVWDARKLLDAKAEEELGAKVFGTPEYTGAKSAIQDMRQALTQYIKDSIQFPGQMENVNLMQDFIQVARQRGIDIGSDEGVRLMQQMGLKTTPEQMAIVQKFEDTMRRISNYYKAIDNVSTKVPDEIRKGGIIKRTVKNPFVQTAIGASAATTLVDKATSD